MKISIGCDHAGFEMKEKLSQWLEQNSYALIDCGTNSLDSVDYPDFAHKVAQQVESGESRFGILLCGSANGVAMAANKHEKIRAALCWTEEIAQLSRLHNDANIICIPARFVDEITARNMIKVFLESKFEEGRHLKRIQKIPIC
ncbi:MAG TPA: ribose 5-phosphate isomerase B [Bacteroidia bacterium]|nr:ribose 5-phosphate isomerase B [Bacteroidia bacterium]HNT79692.1 ribose 5-phosphate isomerase B [Bacteroidia bacterium]